MIPEDLLLHWKTRRIAYSEQMRRAFDDSDTERLKILIAMDYSLKQCIRELEGILDGSLGKMDFLESLLKGIENERNASKSSRSDPAT